MIARIIENTPIEQGHFKKGEAGLSLGVRDYISPFQRKALRGKVEKNKTTNYEQQKQYHCITASLYHKKSDPIPTGVSFEP